ncbi:hypothetical protein ACQ3I4_06695 [Zafaria sp. Z1313]|uniref:hypothetical protein n=1 Tax=Zafaria sp. Z1313 TaxID=3423202 RepID=UPI003D30299B
MDDFAKAIGVRADDVAVPLSQQADSTGTSVDDLARRLKAQADEAAAQGAQTQVFTPEIEFACDAIAGLAFSDEERPYEAANVLKTLGEAVGARNQQVGYQQSAKDIDSTIAKASLGQDVRMDLLVLRLAYCPAAKGLT